MNQLWIVETDIFVHTLRKLEWKVAAKWTINTIYKVHFNVWHIIMVKNNHFNGPERYAKSKTYCLDNGTHEQFNVHLFDFVMSALIYCLQWIIQMLGLVRVLNGLAYEWNIRNTRKSMLPARFMCCDPTGISISRKKNMFHFYVMPIKGRVKAEFVSYIM